MNNSVMKCCICNNKNTGEFITIEDKKYHLICIKNLQTNWNELKKWLEEYIENIKIQYQDSHPTRQYSLEIIKDTLQVTIDKMQELERGEE